MSGRSPRARAAVAGTVVGLISDTHGLIRPEALAALAGVDLIVHAGDIGGPAVLEALRAIAPVVAVRGNNDREAWAASLPDITTTEVGGARVCVVHDLKELRLDPAREGIDVVVHGHSHRPSVEHRERVLIVNPGSAGPRRFTLPIAVARLRLAPEGPRAEIVALDAARSFARSPHLRSP
jgi:putative phosphoesterase